MLQIKTTPNLYGITLSGDYLDLRSLHGSLSRYLQFYQVNMSEFYPYHEYEYLLSLNYDIRKAYEGSRDIEIIDNNASSVGVLAECIYDVPESGKEYYNKIRSDFSGGNLYYSVAILYPIVFHYLISFENILEEEIADEWLTHKKYPDEEWMNEYTLVEAERDRAKIKEFVTLLWENIQSLFGKNKTKAIYEYFDSVLYSFTNSIYCDALIHCQLVSFSKLNKAEKLDFLTLCLYEIIDSEDLKQYPETFQKNTQIYKYSAERIEKKAKKIFPMKEEFFTLLDRVKEPDKPLYEDDFDQFLEREFGPVSEEEPVL